MIKKNKQYRNVFRDRLADYYLTNREITKQYDAEHARAKQSGEKAPWKSSEKIMLAITLTGALLLILKYLVLK